MNVSLHQMDLDWRLIGTVDDIPQQGARCVTHGDMTIAVFRTATDRIWWESRQCCERQSKVPRKESIRTTSSLGWAAQSPTEENPVRKVSATVIRVE